MNNNNNGQYSIYSFTPNQHAFNSGCDKGKQIIKRSIQKFGLTRSILVDKNDNIICGNKVFNEAIEQGIQKVIVVETTGEELVVVKRKDLNIDSQACSEIQFTDNLCCEQNLTWNIEEIKKVMNIFWGFDPRTWGATISWEEKLNIEDFFKEIEEDEKKKQKEEKSSQTELKQMSLFDLWD
ncbi:MAG: hypothetical protein J6S67_17050 [Methanobrevibacter sp.]|nr:hypothetical protein [Methanobrevibacter sp.]